MEIVATPLYHHATIILEHHCGCEVMSLFCLPVLVLALTVVGSIWYATQQCDAIRVCSTMLMVSTKQSMKNHCEMSFYNQLPYQKCGCH